jgi:hypothetical protein
MRFRRTERCAFGAAAVLVGFAAAIVIGAASASATTYTYATDAYIQCGPRDLWDTHDRLSDVQSRHVQLHRPLLFSLPFTVPAALSLLIILCR